VVNDEALHDSGSAPEGGSRWKIAALIGSAVIVLLLIGGFAAAAFALSGSSLDPDHSALAQLDIEALGGSVASVHATGPNGKPVAVVVQNGKLLPREPLAPGETISVDVTVERPSTVGWLVGSETHKHLTIRTPAARVQSRWLTVPKSSMPHVTFDQPVAAVAYGTPGHLHHVTFARPHRAVSLGAQSTAGTLLVRGAPRSWERLGRPQTVTWFPESSSPSVAASPEPGAEITPSTPLRLTFSKPVSKVIGDAVPSISPETPGSWHKADTHTLVFTPKGYGAGLGAHVEVTLPEKVAVIQSDGSLDESTDIDWDIPGGSELRLQQLLAEAGFMPVKWNPDGAAVADTPGAQLHAAVDPPSGKFEWRFPHTPTGLREQWAPGKENVITEGALMSFETQNEMEPDGVAGGEVWKALLKAAIAGKQTTEPGYSYVYVSETIPETTHLWRNGKTILTVSANTGIPGAETELGTFPVFEHLEETTMSGENPDGSHYEDPGIMWVSYFNGGDALHAFDRASYGSPQSLGCVEMQLEDAGKIWPYTPVGTLVTIES
jgi:lipoprotein-anchoring transpeptidase ErfK/SrfK